MKTQYWWSKFLHPRFLPLWLMLSLFWLLTRFPFSAQMYIGRSIGAVAHRLARYRRHIAEVNIKLCFPELNDKSRARLVNRHFQSLGQGIIETALCWWGSEKKLDKHYTLVGDHHLTQALSRGKGVILLSAHFTTLELGGRLLALKHPFHVLYRQHKNPLFETVMQRARTRRFDKAIPHNDTHALLKSLKQNHAVWYAPDQDHGRDQSVFAPFFGVEASTLTATARLARISGAAVIPFFQIRIPDDHKYLLILCPSLSNYPGDDAVADASRINALIESVVREYPEQYLWAHRRFKTRPENSKYPY